MSLYDAAFPIIDRLLANLTHILKKGEANAEERGIDPAIFLNARLAPDMHHLIKQVQIGTDLAKGVPHRLSGNPLPVYEDTEQTFADLYARIEKTRGEYKKYTPEQINGREHEKFDIQLGPMGAVSFEGLAYLTTFALPNIYFHNATAYNILRHNGVPLGKFDFFGGGL